MFIANEDSGGISFLNLAEGKLGSPSKPVKNPKASRFRRMVKKSIRLQKMTEPFKSLT